MHATFFCPGWMRLQDVSDTMMLSLSLEITLCVCVCTFRCIVFAFMLYVYNRVQCVGLSSTLVWTVKDCQLFSGLLYGQTHDLADRSVSMCVSVRGFWSHEYTLRYTNICYFLRLLKTDSRPYRRVDFCPHPVVSPALILSFLHSFFSFHLSLCSVCMGLILCTLLFPKCCMISYMTLPWRLLFSYLHTNCQQVRKKNPLSLNRLLIKTESKYKTHCLAD